MKGYNIRRICWQRNKLLVDIESEMKKRGMI